MIELQVSVDPKEARRLTAKRRSRWSFLLLAFSFPVIGFLWYGMAQAFKWYRAGMYNPDAFLSGGTRLGNILMYVLPFFPSICLGFMIGHLLTSCVPPAREALHPAGRPNLQATQTVLAKFALVAAAITLPFAFLGANTFFSLSANSISYRPLFSFKTAHYTWSDVDSIATGCSFGRSVDYSYLAFLRDGTQIDFLKETRLQFRGAYPQIAAALRGHTYLFNHDGMTPRCLRMTPRSWLSYLMRAPNESH